MKPIDMGSLSVYGTTIRGCGLLVDIFHQVVNSTYGYTWGFSILAPGTRGVFQPKYDILSGASIAMLIVGVIVDIDRNLSKN